MILSILRAGHHPVFQHWCVRTSMGRYPHFILPARSSRGFASTAADVVALFGLAFASAPVQSTLTTAGGGKSPDHYAKGTPSPCPRGRRALTACGRVVSGSLSSPGGGSSHLSLALLGPLSVAREYLALRDGPRRFGPASTCPALLRYRIGRPPLPRTGLSPAVVGRSRPVPLGYWLPKHRPYNPGRACPAGLGWSAFARRY
jgi:hypothetical protein